MQRQTFAQLFSDLRPAYRVRVPFFELRAHTSPTKWSLYRYLLRFAPGSEARWYIRLVFRKNQHLTSPEQTKHHLEKGYEVLDMFTRASQGDAEAQHQAFEFERKSHSRHENERSNEEHKAIAESCVAAVKKPRLTGGYLRPSLYNVPLPRMRNQPLAISMMISKRIKARARRQAAQAYWLGILQDLKVERSFERNAWKADSKTSRNLPYSGTWEDGVKSHLSSLQHSFELDDARLKSKYTRHLLAHIKQARRNKILNKTREKQRERAGEVLNSTLRRRRKGVPAHIWTKMTEEEKLRDRLRRQIIKGVKPES